MKTQASSPVLAPSERHAHCRRGGSRRGSAEAAAGGRALAGSPAVAETGVVMDVLELWIDITELLADTLDECTDIGAIPLRAVPRDEVLAVHQVVDLAVGDVLARTHRHQGDDLELGQRQVEELAAPVRAVGVEAQLELVDGHDV